jgi:murein tripeptide amidase MpaA
MKKFIGIFSFAVILLSFTHKIGAQTIDDKWITLFEKSNYYETPRYTETMEYFNRLAENSKLAKFVSIGKSPQGRDIMCLILSKDKNFDAISAKQAGKPIVLILNGIHSGEINGKDASMLLVRDILITKNKEQLLDNLTLLVIPIFSVDAHERWSAYNRINQIGPKEMGWRTTALNLNLNRDFMKADSPEMQCFLKFYNSWIPDFFIDVHSTDGSDYQYVSTFAIEKHENVSPLMGDWVKNVFNPYLINSVKNKGYEISPFVGFVEGDPSKGIYDWIPLPRFSNGYTAVQNRLGLLIESHILKSYKDRVYSTKAMLESVLELINKEPNTIIEISSKSDDYALDAYLKKGYPYPLDFERTEKYDLFNYKGIGYEMIDSKVAGTKVKKFTGKPFEMEVPYHNQVKASVSVNLPKAYIIPREWKDVVDRIKLHGVIVDSLAENKKYVVEKYKFSDVTFKKFPYEGRFNPSYNYFTVKDTITANKGDYFISTYQRTLGLIAHLLEPKGLDSFVKWGFFNSIFEQTEYYEDYAIEPIAAKMYEENRLLRDEFNNKLQTDSLFKSDARQRFDFFYERTPYFDSSYNWYPVLRVVE